MAFVNYLNNPKGIFLTHIAPIRQETGKAFSNDQFTDNAAKADFITANDAYMKKMRITGSGVLNVCIVNSITDPTYKLNLPKHTTRISQNSNKNRDADKETLYQWMAQLKSSIVLLIFPQSEKVQQRRHRPISRLASEPLH